MRYAMSIRMTRSNEPKFQADFYSKYRPFYPPILFKPLQDLNPAPGAFLDLGCGAGQSLASFLSYLATQGIESPSGYGVDPDVNMLSMARQRCPTIEFKQGSAEAIPLPDTCVDTVIVGSAFHWFDRVPMASETARVLRPGGRLFIFEYQFPKCLDEPELFQRVKRRFNLEWKAPVQTPRGSLADLTEVFRGSSQWRLLNEDRPIWQEHLDLDGFLGHLFSQSRYLHAEAKQPDPNAYRAEIQDSLRAYFTRGPLQFDLKPRSFLFQKA